jgi:hypothetical protein
MYELDQLYYNSAVKMAKDIGAKNAFLRYAERMIPIGMLDLKIY